MYSLEVHMVDHCNLNCKSCSHFCPIAKPKFADLNELVRDLIRINCVGLTPHLFKILGGEPLLHPHITESLELFRGIFPNSKIVIWTNGLMLPKMPELFFSRCDDLGIQIVVTPYIKIKTIPEIQEIIDKYWFIVKDFYFKGKFWKSPLGLWNEPTNPYENYRKCRYKTGHCIILKDHRLYQCSIAAYAENLNERFGTNYEISEKDSVDIYNIWDERWLHRILYKATPFCRYCSMEKNEDFTWSLSKRCPEEWINR